MPDTRRSMLDRALRALDGLQELGEEIEDEWTYVTELADAWRARLDAAAGERGDEALPGEAVVAVERAIHEADLITDPHRAIDWLSTFPQIVLLVVGEQP